VSKPTKPPRESPFTQGLEVPKGALKLEPEVPGARWLTVPPLGIGRYEIATLRPSGKRWASAS